MVVDRSGAVCQPKTLWLQVTRLRAGSVVTLNPGRPQAASGRILHPPRVKLPSPWTASGYATSNAPMGTLTNGRMDLPNDDALRWIVATCARLRATHAAAIGIPELVLPTAEFFPDEFQPDAPSVSRLLQRMMEYAPLADTLRVELAFLEPEESARG